MRSRRREGTHTGGRERCDRKEKCVATGEQTTEAAARLAHTVASGDPQLSPCLARSTLASYSSSVGILCRRSFERRLEPRASAQSLISCRSFSPPSFLQLFSSLSSSMLLFFLSRTHHLASFLCCFVSAFLPCRALCAPFFSYTRPLSPSLSPHVLLACARACDQASRLPGSCCSFRKPRPSFFSKSRRPSHLSFPPRHHHHHLLLISLLPPLSCSLHSRAFAKKEHGRGC